MKSQLSSMYELKMNMNDEIQVKQTELNLMHDELNRVDGLILEEERRLNDGIIHGVPHSKIDFIISEKI